MHSWWQSTINTMPASYFSAVDLDFYKSVSREM
jgi:hypothetical protein